MSNVRRRSTAATRQKKFEDPNDPERCRAKEFGHSTPIKQHGRVVGHCHSFFMEDLNQSVNVVEWKDGETSMYLEDFTQDVDD